MRKAILLASIAIGLSITSMTVNAAIVAPDIEPSDVVTPLSCPTSTVHEEGDTPVQGCNIQPQNDNPTTNSVSSSNNDKSKLAESLNVIQTPRSQVR